MACNNQPATDTIEEKEESSALKAMKEEIMSIHDTAMLRMTTSKRLMAELKEAWQTEVDSMPYQQAYRNLRQANDDMMEWMRNFELPEGDDVKDEELEAYLQEERRAIQAVDQNLKKAIEDGQELVKMENAEAEETATEGHEGHQH